MAKSVSIEYLKGHAYAQRVATGTHTYDADESLEAGGDGLGPSPYELLLGALGSCTSITLIMYARRHNWPLDDVTVHLTHDRVQSEDGASGTGSTPRVEVVTLDISLKGALSTEQRERLLEIAGRCPVH